MANFHKERRQLTKVLATYGLTIQDGSKHYDILKGNAKVSSLSHTPADSNAYRQLVRDLVRAGYLPEGCKRIKF